MTIPVCQADRHPPASSAAAGRLSNGPVTVFITSGGGFIGSHLVEHFLAQGPRVIDFNKPTYAARTEVPFKCEPLVPRFSRRKPAAASAASQVRISPLRRTPPDY
jgi:hypothetical protein